MHFDWLVWSNPVALWWSFLVTVSVLNVALLVGLRAVYRANPFGAVNAIFAAEPLAILSALLEALESGAPQSMPAVT